jgi:hypothetical protein
MAKVSALPDLRRALLAEITRDVVRAIHERETEPPVYHPTTRDPKDCGAPMPLRPPVEGTRDTATAGVVCGWIFNLTPRMRLRGVRVRLLEVWHG